MAENASVLHPTSNPNTLNHLSLQSRSSVLKKSTGWNLLPDELLCNILKHISFNDLLKCKTLDRRTAEVIRSNLLIPRAYWIKSQPTPCERYFSAEEYDRETRSWLLEAGRNEQVLWLDSLRLHRSFPKVLFYVVSETTKWADSWDLNEKRRVKLETEVLGFENPRLGIFNFFEDRQALIFFDTSLILHIMTIGLDSVPTDDCRISLNSDDVVFVCLAPNNCILAVVTHSDMVYIVEKQQDHWAETYRNHCSYPPEEPEASAMFSSDSRYLLIAWCMGAVRVLKKHNNEWITAAELTLQDLLHEVLFLVGHSFLGSISWKTGFAITDLESRKRVEQNSAWDHLHAHSPCGRTLAVGTINKLAAIVTFTGGEWKTFSVPQEQMPVNQVNFSPDGKHMVILSEITERSLHCDERICVMSFDGTKWQQKGSAESEYRSKSI